MSWADLSSLVTSRGLLLLRTKANAFWRFVCFLCCSMFGKRIYKCKCEWEKTCRRRSNNSARHFPSFFLISDINGEKLACFVDVWFDLDRLLILDEEIQSISRLIRTLAFGAWCKNKQYLLTKDASLEPMLFYSRFGSVMIRNSNIKKCQFKAVWIYFGFKGCTWKTSWRSRQVLGSQVIEISTYVQ